MTITVRPVSVDYAAQTWPLVEEFLEKAIKYGGGDYSLDQIKMHVLLGTWLLLVAVDDENKIHGAMTVSFINYPNDRVAFVTNTGGREICTEDSLNQMKAIVKGLGATKVQAAGRASMVRMLRLLGFTERYTVVEAKI